MHRITKTYSNYLTQPNLLKHFNQPVNRNPRVLNPVSMMGKYFQDIAKIYRFKLVGSKP